MIYPKCGDYQIKDIFDNYQLLLEKYLFARDFFIRDACQQNLYRTNIKSNHLNYKRYSKNSVKINNRIRAKLFFQTEWSFFTPFKSPFKNTLLIMFKSNRLFQYAFQF